MASKERRCQRAPSGKRKAQMFVITMIFMVGLIFTVQNLLFQYTALDLSLPFRENSIYILKNTNDIINKSIKTTPDCVDFSAKMVELKNFLDKSVPRGTYSLSVSYKMSCANWNSLTSPPMNLTVNVIGKSADTSARIYMYHR